jgi:hypothetical protein
MSPAAVTERLQRACAQSDLRSQRRLDYKLDMSASGITRRLEKVEALRRLCVELVRIGERNGLGRARTAASRKQR